MKTRLIAGIAVLAVSFAYAQEPGGPPGRGGKGKGPKGGGKMRPTAEAPWRQKWEYSVLSWNEIRTRGKDDFQAGLNQLGAEGWELVTLDHQNALTHYFKRPTSPAGQLFDLMSGGKDVITRADMDAQRGPGSFDRMAQRMGLIGDRITRADYVNAMQQRVSGTSGPGAAALAKSEATGSPTLSNMKVFHLREAAASDMANLVNEIFNGTGARVFSFAPSNSLIAEGNPEQLNTIAALVLSLEDKMRPESKGQRQKK
jgi:hypothetical protein